MCVCVCVCARSLLFFQNLILLLTHTHTHTHTLSLSLSRSRSVLILAQGVSPLPENIYLMSWFLRTGSPSSGQYEYVLRLQNVAEHSADVTVDLAVLFPSLTQISVEETTLALDTPHQRQQWGSVRPETRPRGLLSSVVTLSSLDMRTFIVRVLSHTD